MKLDRSTVYRPTSRRRVIGLAWAAALAGVVLLVGLIAAQIHYSHNGQSIRRHATAPAAPLPAVLAQPNAFKPLTVDQAIAANAEVPFVQRKDDPARKFVLNAAGDDRNRAVECLAQAVYYEAASEGADGQRAVAQVVLNRMRHPGYPSSVCGVVYQGSQRVMGCQFTFTCDGSLLRPPNPAMFAFARKIAVEALGGRVFAPVGHATNYHADYVLPYWASALDKQVQIGRHIFYRLKGGLGSSSAFGQRYAGSEPSVLSQRAILAAGAAVAPPVDPLASAITGTIANDRPANPIIAADAVVREPLTADTHSSGLKIDDGAPVVVKKKVAQAIDCPTSGSTMITPTAPNDLRSTGKSAC